MASDCWGFAENSNAEGVCQFQPRVGTTLGLQVATNSTLKELDRL